MRPRCFALAVVVVCLVAAAPAAAEESAACADPFGGDVAAEVDRRYGGHHVTIAVFDERTGCEHLFRPGERVTTASVAKVSIYAATLLRAQREGRWLTPAEAAGVWPMIIESANPPASALWRSLGGVAGMGAFFAELGLTETVPVDPWGLTSTSARDQVRLLRQVVVGDGGVLAEPYRLALRDAMRAVVPSQRWGVPGGVPPAWSVAVKNGFAPSRCCGWRLNSVGVVAGPDGAARYSMAILTDGWPNERAGIEAVDWLARAVNLRLVDEPFVGAASRGAFVDRLHTDVLAAPAGVAAAVWLAEAAGPDGAGVPALLDGLLGADASGRADAVVRAYRAVLGRAVDPAGLAHWKAVVRAGGLDALAAGLLAAPEVQARHPDGGRAAVAAALASTSTGEPVVVQAYDAFLGRLPSAAEIAAWGGTSRAGVAAAVVGSAERRG